MGCYFSVMGEGWMVGVAPPSSGSADELGGKLQCKHNVYLRTIARPSRVQCASVCRVRRGR